MAAVGLARRRPESAEAANERSSLLVARTAVLPAGDSTLQLSPSPLVAAAAPAAWRPSSQAGTDNSTPQPAARARGTWPHGIAMDAAQARLEHRLLGPVAAGKQQHRAREQDVTESTADTTSSNSIPLASLRHALATTAGVQRERLPAAPAVPAVQLPTPTATSDADGEQASVPLDTLHSSTATSDTGTAVEHRTVPQPEPADAQARVRIVTPTASSEAVAGDRQAVLAVREAETSATEALSATEQAEQVVAPEAREKTETVSVELSASDPTTTEPSTESHGMPGSCSVRLTFNTAGSSAGVTHSSMSLGSGSQAGITQVRGKAAKVAPSPDGAPAHEPDELDICYEAGSTAELPAKPQVVSWPGAPPTGRIAQRGSSRRTRTAGANSLPLISGMRPPQPRAPRGGSTGSTRTDTSSSDSADGCGKLPVPSFYADGGPLQGRLTESGAGEGTLSTDTRSLGSGDSHEINLDSAALDSGNSEIDGDAPASPLGSITTDSVPVLDIEPALGVLPMATVQEESESELPTFEHWVDSPRQPPTRYVPPPALPDSQPTLREQAEVRRPLPCLPLPLLSASASMTKFLDYFQCLALPMLCKPGEAHS